MGLGGTSPALSKGTLVDEGIARAAIKSKFRVQLTAQYRERLKSDTDAMQGRVGVVISVSSTDRGCRADVLWDNGKAFKGYCVGYRGFSDLELAIDVSVAEDSVAELRDSRRGSSSFSSSPNSTPETSGASTPVERRSHSPCTQTVAAAQAPLAPSVPSTRSIPVQQGRAAGCPLQVASAQNAMRAQQLDQQCGILKARLAEQGKTEASESMVLDVNVGYLHSAPTVNHAGGKHIWMADGPISYK